MMQEREKVTDVEDVLSLWIDEHYMQHNQDTYISIFDQLEDHFHPAEEESALAAYEQAIELAPREAILYYHKGQVLEQLGRATEAENAYEEARSLGHNGLREETRS